jgi:8-oxo-dGTP diphosphatase
MIDVVCGLVIHMDRILITQRGDKKNYGKWEFPGGKVITGEHPFDSIKRELIEELKLEVEPKKEITRYNHQQFNLIFIECFVSNPDDIQLNEHLNFRWIEKSEFSDFDFLEGDLSFIQEYNDLQNETIQIK